MSTEATATTALAQTAATQQTQAQTTEASTQSTSAGDFFSLSLKDLAPEKLPEDLRDWGSLKKYPTTADAFRSFRELEKTFNSRKEPKPPGEGATAEEVAAWRKLIGAPEKPEDYGLKKPEQLPEGVEWNEQFATDFAKLAHDLHLPPGAVEKLVEFHNGNLSAMQAMAKEAQAQQVETVKAELQKMWGTDTAKNSAMAIQLAEMGGIENAAADPDIANSPKVAKMLHNLATMFNKLTAEPGQLITGQTPELNGPQAQLEKLSKHPDYLAGGEKALAIQEQMKRIHDSMQKK